MTGSSLVQGIGLLVCLGAIILVALVAFAARAVSRSHDQGRNRSINSPSAESPEEIGSVPATGGDLIGSSGFSRGAQVYDQDQLPGRQNDDDQTTPAGGLGGQ